jgi:hypothetical protein
LGKELGQGAWARSLGKELRARSSFRRIKIHKRGLEKSPENRKQRAKGKGKRKGNML